MTHPWDDAPKGPRRDPFHLPLEPQSETGKRLSKGPKKPKKKKKVRPVIPELPRTETAITGDEIKRGVSQRARAAANLKVEGYTYADIADLMEFPSPEAAKRAVESVLAAIHGPGDYETLRLIATARSEEALKRSTAMAKASYLIDRETGDLIPNTDQLRWHQQAGVDLMNWAAITGARAPTKHEITPGDEQMDRLLNMILERSGHEEIVDADVIDLDIVAEPLEIEAGDDG